MSLFYEGLGRYIPEPALRRIRNAKIGIAGAGGLGSNCAACLVRCGFRDFVIVDHDTVDASNLNRQFFFVDQVGQPKVKALRENLLRINPDTTIDARIHTLEKSDYPDVFSGCHVIVEAFDSAEAKQALVESYWGRSELVVAASGIAGYGWNDQTAFSVRQVGSNLVLIGDGTSEATDELPPYAPRVVQAAAMQADRVLEFFLEKKDD